jgi:GntR family transcriptional repressor for pyruvate dehydrogenase complex
MAFTLVTRQKAYVQIAAQIVESIMKGELTLGERLPSAKELEAKFGVSRATVREALSALELAGVVQIRTGQGAFVVNLPSTQGEGSRFVLDQGESAAEVLEVRLILEPEGARLAAQRATEDDIQMLERSVGILRAVVAEGRPAVASDIQFHVALAKSSGNSLIYDIMRGVADYLGQALWRSLRQQAWARADLARIYLEHHETALRAIRDRDRDAAANAIRVHLTRVQQDLFVEP